MKRFSLHVAVLFSMVLPSTEAYNFTYYTTKDSTRLVEILMTKDGFSDCAVFSGETVKGKSHTVAPGNIHIVSGLEVANLIERCNDLHMTLDNSRRRKKRFLGILYPGTKWCGAGSRSSNYDDLGTHNFTDACCRDHDHCNVTIGPFLSEYSLFNWSLYTRSGCDCDEEFYSCLKEGGDRAAAKVGKIFFNYLHMKCVGDGHPMKCVKYWWIFCTKYAQDTSRVVKKFIKNPHF